METTLTATWNAGGASLAPHAPLPVLWRDPHTVEPDQLKAIITRLEEACAAHPQSADLRTCLGMAHAMNYDAYKSMDALAEARRLEPGNFWAQLKYAELQYRLRALPLAEGETLKALNLARHGLEAATARKQLQAIRRLMREGTQKPEWSKPLRPAALWCAGVVAALMSVMAVLR